LEPGKNVTPITFFPINVSLPAWWQKSIHLLLSHD
jgi:hypothetical protein